MVTPLYTIYKNNIDKIIGKEISPIGAPTLPGLDHSSSPGKYGSSQELDLAKNPRAGAAKAEV
ncbi:MAG: hypothetical protein ACK5KN_16900 [Dysgonomonas sp.]|uniref:hypothetical protein n=1 Tax=Dysgonomonas sp. TaxID=1891233 RepID=UPI003A842D06